MGRATNTSRKGGVMRFARILVSVVASLASFATGSASSDELPAERERDPAQRIESGGFAASGPSFYVWEEDLRQGRQWAAELERSVES
jgi:hypothetical protein